MTFDTYSRTFHPNWIGILGVTVVAVSLVVAIVFGWRRRDARQLGD